MTSSQHAVTLHQGATLRIYALCMKVLLSCIQADGVAMRDAIAAGPVMLTFKYFPSFGTVPNPSGGRISSFRSVTAITVCFLNNLSAADCHSMVHCHVASHLINR